LAIFHFINFLNICSSKFVIKVGYFKKNNQIRATIYRNTKSYFLEYKKTTMKKKILLSLSALFTSMYLFAQITVTNTQTASQLVQNVLMGFGVTASNISLNGVPFSANNVYPNVTYFNAGTTSFPIQSGVLLTTGNGIGAKGPNNTGSSTANTPPTPSVATDPHLNAIIPGATPLPTNGVVLEFDFIPAGDTISFKYMFGSDEYPEFANSSFNDAFGFFLWGPGISGPYVLTGYPNGGQTLAVIPGTTTPVTINTVNPTQNPTFYVNNQNGVAYGSAIQYDGTTVLLTANASVQCGQTYHIKLAICNVSDQSYDSGVFLQANSFSSEAVQVNVTPTVAGDTNVYEGCTQANISFIRPEAQINDTLVINYSIAGTAIAGVDYNTLPNPLTFLPGEDTITLSIIPIQDNFSDNNEYVEITVTTISGCGDTIISQGTLYIVDTIPINIIETDKLVKCIDDSVLVTASASGLFPPFTFSWQGGQTGTTAFFPTVQNALTGTINYIVTATNACGYSAVDTVTITLNQTLIVDSILMGPATCDPTGYVSAMIQGQTVTPQHGVYYQWTAATGLNGPTASVWDQIPSGWYYISVEDAVCTVKDSVFVDIMNPPVANFTVSSTSGCSPLEVTITNSSQNTTTYAWNFGNGNSTTVTNLDPINQTFNASGTIQLIASQSPTCADTMEVAITVNICGCTDPSATNYNASATVDDGSCTYPFPAAEAPNVFTPDGDGTNDVFFISTKNATNVELTILNRWGHKMFEGSSLNPAWNGKAQNGSDAIEGVYFYKYTVYGPNNQQVEGEGFLQLVR
jgi:gliding motility-associated-like protein